MYKELLKREGQTNEKITGKWKKRYRRQFTEKKDIKWSLSISKGVQNH